MALFIGHEIKKKQVGGVLVLYLDKGQTEFASELGELNKTDQNRQGSIQQYIRNYIPNIKVKTVKILMGTLMVSSFVFTGVHTEAKAATMNTSMEKKVEDGKGKNYTVQSGDSLSVIGKKYNVTVDKLKEANHLTSDIIMVGQTLKIPTGVVQTSATATEIDVSVQKQLRDLGYLAAPASTGSTVSTIDAIKTFQGDYGLPVTGTLDTPITTEIAHAVVKKSLVQDTLKYQGVPYLWGGTTPSGFDCSGFVYYMFNTHDVNMARSTSANLYQTGKAISKNALQPGDLVFFGVNTPGEVSHVGFYIGNNDFISATTSKGIAVYSMGNSYWSKYYMGAKRVY